MSSLSIIGINPTQVVLAVDVAKGKSPHALGDVGSSVDSSGYKVYKWVEWTDGSAAAGVAGEVAYYHTLDGYKLHLVSSDVSESLFIGAGVIQAIMAEGDEGWLQIKGPATLSIALTAGTDGDALTPTGAGDGTLDVNIATAANTHICARAGDISDKEILCDFPF